MLNARLISRDTVLGLNIDPTGFEIRSDRGSDIIIAGGIKRNTAKSDIGIPKLNITTLIAKNGSEIRNRLNSSLNAYSVSFNPGILLS